MSRGVIYTDNVVDWRGLISIGAKGDPGPAGGATGSVTSTQITDATTVGRNVLKAADAAAARTAIGALGSVNAAAISDSTTVGRSVLTAVDAAAVRTAINALSSTATSATGLSRNAGVTTNVVEVKHPTSGLVHYAISGADGGPIVNGVKSKAMLFWKTGDPDPTTNGPIDTDAFHYTIKLGIGESVPSWALSYPDFFVDQETTGGGGGSTITYVAKSNMQGIADETAVAVGTAGTGDTAVAYLFSAAAPVVEATGVPASFASGVRMVRHAASNTTPALGYSTGGSTTLRIRTFLRTPASWPGEFSVIAVKNGTGVGSDRIRVNIGSTTSPGRIVVKNSDNTTAAATSGGILSTSTDYYVELALTQNATATAGTARLYVYATDGSLVHDTGLFTDGATTPVGFGSNNDAVYFGNLSAITSTYYTGRYAITADPSTAIGVTA